MPPTAAPVAAPIAAPLPPPKIAPMPAPVAAPTPVPTAALVPCCDAQPATSAPTTAKADRRVNNFVFILISFDSKAFRRHAPTMRKGLRTGFRTSLYNNGNIEKHVRAPGAMRPRIATAAA